MDIVFAAGYAFVAALIFWRRPDDRVAVFASLALLIFGTATFGFTLPALAADHPGLQTPVALLHFLGAACFGLFLYVFPDGRFVPRWTGAVAVVWIGWQLAEHIFPAWTTDPAGWQILIETVVWLAALGTVIYSQIHRYRHLASPAATAADQVGRVRDLGGVRRISGDRPGPERRWAPRRSPRRRVPCSPTSSATPSRRTWSCCSYR